MALVFVGLVAGCATTAKIDWNSRVGYYTHDQAVIDFGPPDKEATLTDGTKVGEWLTHRGHAHGAVGFMPRYRYGYWTHFYYDTVSPDYYLRLTFNPEGKLKEWKKLVK